MALTIALLIGLIVGMVVGHVLAIGFANETLTRSTAFYRELVARGDTALAMLKAVHDKVAEVQGEPERNKKRVIVANAMNDISRIVKQNPPTVG